MLSVSSLSRKGFFCFKLFQTLSKADASESLKKIQGEESVNSPLTGNNAFAHSQGQWRRIFL